MNQFNMLSLLVLLSAGLSPAFAQSPSPAPRPTPSPTPPHFSQLDLIDDAERRFREFIYELGDRLAHPSIWKEDPWDTTDVEIASWFKLRGGFRYHPTMDSDDHVFYQRIEPKPQARDRGHWSEKQGELLAGIGLEFTEDLSFEFERYLSPISRSGTAEKYGIVFDTRSPELRKARPVHLDLFQREAPLQAYSIVRGGMQQLHIDEGDAWGAIMRVETGVSSHAFGRFYVLGSASQLMQKLSGDTVILTSDETPVNSSRSWKAGVGYAFEISRRLQIGAEATYYRGGYEPGTMLMMDEDISDRGVSIFFMMSARF